MSKARKWSRTLLGCTLSAMLVVSPVPREAKAGLVEYALILVLISVIAFDFPPGVPPGSQVLVDQLQTSIDGAQTANQLGNRILEASLLSKASGAAEALIGMTSSCSDCDDLRSTLQQIIGEAAFLKTAAVGASGSCHPNGVLQPNEACDPRAIPTGCPVAVEVTYCSDECRCVPVL